MIHHMIMTADEAIEKLKSGNMRYLLMNSNSGNVSAALRKFTYEHGQHPHAIIVTCSDSSPPTTSVQVIVISTHKNGGDSFPFSIPLCL